MAETSATLKNPNEADVVVPVPSCLIHQSGPCKAQTYLEDDNRLRQTQPDSSRNAAAGPDAGSLPASTSTALGRRPAAPGLANVLFSIPTKKEGRKQFPFRWTGSGLLAVLTPQSSSGMMSEGTWIGWPSADHHTDALSVTFANWTG